MKIVLARSEHLEAVSTLFDHYRVFYNQPSDHNAAREFLKERFQKGDSSVFVAINNECIAGFIQLYPSFSSVSMKRVWILNDLFVQETYRKQGVAKLLMDAAEGFARETGAVRITLATQISNVVAQSLYESRGYIEDEAFYHYALQVKP
jgi:GNAT superfamily N-acetyltransferase